MTANRCPKLGYQAVYCALTWIALQALPASSENTTLPEIYLDWLPKSCYLTGQYQQFKTLPGLPKPVQSSGDFIFSCDDGLIWRTAHPIEETLIYSKKGLQTRLTADEHAENLNNITHRNLNRLLNGVIGADRQYIDRYFEAEPTSAGIVLQPRKRRMKKFIESVALAKQEEKTKLTLHQRNDSLTEIEIFSIRNLDTLDRESCVVQFAYHSRACETLFQ